MGNNTDLIIFSGQSNMQGQTGTPPIDPNAVERALEYRFLTDELVPLKQPTGESIDLFGKALDRTKYTTTSEVLANSALLSVCTGDSNMLPAFCRSYIKETDRNVVAVHTAKGSTEIDYWQKGTPAYEIMSKKIKRAIEVSTPDHVYLAWLQGESDAIVGRSKAEYKELLTAFCNAVKEDFGVENFGVIQVGQFTNDERDFEIINAQKEVCAENEDFLMLTTVTKEIIHDPEYLHPTVPGHYNAKAQELIGTLAGTALGQYIKQKSII